MLMQQEDVLQKTKQKKQKKKNQKTSNYSFNNTI